MKMMAKAKREHGEHLKLLKALEKHFSGDEREIEHEEERENGEDEDGESEFETKGKHHASDDDEEGCSYADGEGDEEEYDDEEMKPMHRMGNLRKKHKMSPEDSKKMAIIVLSKKLGKRD